MVLITLSTFIAVVIIQTHIRGDRKNKVPPWLKRVCLPVCLYEKEILPTVIKLAAAGGLLGLAISPWVWRNDYWRWSWPQLRKKRRVLRNNRTAGILA